MSNMSDYFNELDDPRTGNAVRHIFSEVMFIGFLTVLSGGETAVDMETFSRARENLLREFLTLPKGPPSHDTFSRIFRCLDPKSFAEFFAKFMKDFRSARENSNGSKGGVAIDGKVLRHSFDTASEKSALNMVCAWAHEERLTLGAVDAGQGGDEILALRELIGLLDLRGQIVTADALHCQRETAEILVENKADYCLSLKGNQKSLYNDVKLLMEDSEVHFCDEHTTVDGDHGRIETRTYKVLEDIDYIQTQHEWPHLKSIVSVQATREIKGKKSTETRYYLLSCKLSAAEAGRHIRNHWGIENSLHWVLDMIMGEDNHRARKDHAPKNFALLRRCALNIIKADKSKGSNRVKFLQAAWSEDFLRSLIKQI